MINIPLGFENLPGLSAKDFVTLAIIRHYIDFKVSIVEGKYYCCICICKNSNYTSGYNKQINLQKLSPMSQVTYSFTEGQPEFTIKINSHTSMIPALPRVFLCTAANVFDCIENKTRNQR